MNTRARQLLIFAVVLHLAAAAILIPTGGYSFDIAGFTGPAERFLRWGETPFYNWKGGIDAAVIAFGSECGRFALERLGISGVAATHIAWKLPILIADILGAIALSRIAAFVAPSRVYVVATLWLLNPALIWVSLVHGQVEAAALAVLFWSIERALNKRYFASGLLAALGCGFEYFPIVAVTLPLVELARGRLRPISAIAMLLGTSLGLALCFAHLADPVAFAGIVNGLKDTASSHAIAKYALSLWYALGIHNTGWWFKAFVGVCCAIVAWAIFDRRVEPVPAALRAIGGCLITAVLFDQNAFAQFTLIALAGLYLIGLTGRMPYTAGVIATLAGIMTYIVSESVAAFFYDALRGRVVLPWLPSLPPALIRPLVAAFVAATLGGAVYALLFRRRASQRYPIVALVASVTPVLLLAGWGLQPSLWSVFTDRGSDELADFSTFHQHQDGAVRADGNSFVLTLPKPLMSAALSGSYAFHVSARGQSPDLFAWQHFNDVRSAAQWGTQAVDFPMWPAIRKEIDATRWFALYVGDNPRETKLRVANCDVAPEGARLVGVGVFAAYFNVPSHCLNAGSNVRFEFLPASSRWRGGGSFPYLEVAPAYGMLPVQLNGKASVLRYAVDIDKQAALGPLPFVHQSILLQPQPTLFEINRITVDWPDGGMAHVRGASTIGWIALAIDVIVLWLSLRTLLRPENEAADKRQRQQLRCELQQ